MRFAHAGAIDVLSSVALCGAMASDAPDGILALAEGRLVTCPDCILLMEEP